MSVSIDVPDQLADLLRTLATQQGVSIEELGQQALAVGLTTLAGGLAGVEAIDLAQVGGRPRARVLMPSPTIVRGSVRPLQIVFEPDPEAAPDAH